ncbi:MAG: hypothetical protein JXR25_10100 [Pontiellaceae bacterium]|nr:hypothetical protein [Pontiellaceae bacterium]MBN2785170.1 hypothetical protein [Pontiellaceae bacterium]
MRSCRPLYAALIGLGLCTALPSCSSLRKPEAILGRSDCPAICYSGHRKTVRSVENTPTIEETKEDLRILHAMGIRIVRTYNTTLFPHSERILQSIRELKQTDPGFEMYVMLGAWIQCKNAYREGTDHTIEDAATNQREIDAAIRLAQEYPDIVRIIAVGNETMVDWQAHFVPAAVILKYVNQLKAAKTERLIPQDTLITTSDNWAALGGEARYRNADLDELMRQIDYVSLHTYAFHDTFYHPELQWGPKPGEEKLPPQEQAALAIARTIEHQQSQVDAVKNYLALLGIEKEIHIGETGWASLDNSHYGREGTGAADEYVAGLFYKAVREWTRKEHMTCFYFEAFDEPWKSGGTAGSEGHFGLFTVDGKAKYPIWDSVDSGALSGLKRAGQPIRKTHDGNEAELLKELRSPRHFKNQ